VIAGSSGAIASGSLKFVLFIFGVTGSAVISSFAGRHCMGLTDGSTNGKPTRPANIRIAS
jgi:hypothetical protein